MLLLLLLHINQALSRAMSGNYVNFGVFEVFE
jgi:hypothetical protein